LHIPIGFSILALMFNTKHLLPILVVVVLLVLGSIYSLSTKKSEQQIQETPVPITNPMVVQAENDFENFNFDKHISYSLPLHWQDFNKRISHATRSGERKSETYSHSIILSPKSDPLTSKTNDIRINISAEKKDLGFDVYLDPSEYADGERVTIDEVSAVKSHYDDQNQGHFLMYNFVHNNLHWNIWIQTKDLEAEKARQNDIDAFINSIKLHQP
jgi:hypothetical protein